MRRAHRVRCVLLGSLPLVLPALAGAQNLWHVDVNSTPPGLGTPTHPYTSIQYAIERPTTKSGDTLLVAPGTYVENLKDYPKTLHVRSRQGPLVTELRPLDPGAAIVYWESFSTIEGFTLTGNASNGLNGGALNLSSSSRIVHPSACPRRAPSHREGRWARLGSPSALRIWPSSPKGGPVPGWEGALQGCQTGSGQGSPTPGALAAGAEGGASGPACGPATPRPARSCGSTVKGMSIPKVQLSH